MCVPRRQRGFHFAPQRLADRRQDSSFIQNFCDCPDHHLFPAGNWKTVCSVERDLIQNVQVAASAEAPSGAPLDSDSGSFFRRMWHVGVGVQWHMTTFLSLGHMPLHVTVSWKALHGTPAPSSLRDGLPSFWLLVLCDVSPSRKLSTTSLRSATQTGARTAGQTKGASCCVDKLTPCRCASRYWSDSYPTPTRITLVSGSSTTTPGVPHKTSNPD
ncbi:hypothetical protein EVG20_g10259 [Dentipellis fragilis]|uniref:Uncharacterized protein n=1 Tax=Dentipellis fragilis TaxID=205917 RepID=A0A4Y9XUR4_9AGAM|nr:hypothetical protein EVG20_g10259 [Dentipellis fragilis]